MAEKEDFFAKKLSNSRSFKKRSRSSNRVIWVVALVAIFCIAGVGAYILFFKSPNLVVDPSQELQFSLGSEITLQGELKMDGDIFTYTHTITDPTYGVLAVKSKVFNLSDFVGIVDATGIVEKMYQGMPIIDIVAISGTTVGEHAGDIDIVLDEPSGLYLLSAGVYFLPTFFQEYLLLNEGENGQIELQDLETNEHIILNYFRCNASNPDRNCKGLVETFSQSAARSFVTINGDTYYKLPEINSWFVANGDRWGIFINDVTEDTVMKLKDLMVFANKKVISDWEKFAVPRICKDDSEKLVKISSSTLTLKQEGLMAVIQGEGTSHTVECSVQIDFSLPNKGKLISFQVGDAPVATGNVVQESTPVVEEKTPDTVSRETSQTIVPTEWNPKVSQFPLNEEKGLTYSSSRGGYAVKFPSANISYSVSAVKESFGQADLSCSYVINVIKYSDKELLEISPSIRIYECTSKGGVTSPGENYVIKKIDEKVFVVQINDASWIDFSNTLTFSVL